jgi:hypothetical protein
MYIKTLTENSMSAYYTETFIRDTVNKQVIFFYLFVGNEILIFQIKSIFKTIFFIYTVICTQNIQS